MSPTAQEVLDRLNGITDDEAFENWIKYIDGIIHEKSLRQELSTVVSVILKYHSKVLNHYEGLGYEVEIKFYGNYSEMLIEWASEAQI
jgi:hypothetical protein